MSRVGLIILNYRGVADTLACLDAVERLDRPPDRITVIDNASEDQSAAALRQARPALELRVNPRNLGFGAGQNAVLTEMLEAGFDWIWLLNNDTQPQPMALTHLLARGESRPDIGAVGARLVDMQPPHAPQAFGGGRINWWRGSSRHCQVESASHRAPDYLTGACLLLRADALRQTGLFDPRFFLYWEDADLCLRLKQAGWDLAVAADAVIRHRQSAATGEASASKDRLINASGVRFFRKHGRLGGWPAIILGTSARIGKRVVTGRGREALAVLKGLADGLKK